MCHWNESGNDLSSGLSRETTLTNDVVNWTIRKQKFYEILIKYKRLF